MKKRLMTMLLAVALAVGVAVPAFGATVSNQTLGHTYDAYQVFSGTQAAGDAALGDVEWGEGVNGAALLTELKEDFDYFDSCSTAADVANVLAGKADDCDEAKALASTATKHLTATKVVIGSNTTVELAAGYWLLVDTTDPGEGDAKNAALLQVTNDGDITIAKKYDAPEVTKTVDDNDANIGDTVTFTLTATMPFTLEGYETYKVIFHDTLSAGLDFTENSVKVMIGDEEVTSSFVVAESNGALTISCGDVIALGATTGSAIVVTYDAVLDPDAVIGTTGNPNKVSLEYSNDPNWNGSGDEPTGNTPEEIVYVYTWEIPVVKVDGEDAKKFLADAEFTLYKDEACAQALNVVSAGNNTYKACTLTGCADHTHATVIKTDSTGKFEIEGLEQGTYYLKETKAPAGYNLLANPAVIEIGENGALTVDSAVADNATIKNNKGSVLPETGGIGTVMFYMVGGALVIGAVVLLVTRRRSGVEE